MRKSFFFRLALAVSVLLAFPVLQISAQNKAKTTQTTKQGKLTIDQRVKIMTKTLKLTSAEAVQVEQILSSTQLEKAKIKASKVSEKKKAEQVEYIKDVQKAKLKKVLGKDRYKKYKEMKESDVL
ncbi:MAG: hypothetical protein JXR27_10675 [Paludibacteraceae bacterium]|nr:hypothetical protein [Paludibacteraceae bacterium]